VAGPLSVLHHLLECLARGGERESIASAGVAAWRKARTDAEREWIIGLFAINGTLNVVWSALLPPASSGLGADRGGFSLALCARADDCLLALRQARELAAALSRLGQLCRLSQLGDRQAERSVRQLG
jgi:hypothetical protein